VQGRLAPELAQYAPLSLQEVAVQSETARTWASEQKELIRGAYSRWKLLQAMLKAQQELAAREQDDLSEDGDADDDEDSDNGGEDVDDNTRETHNASDGHESNDMGFSAEDHGEKPGTSEPVYNATQDDEAGGAYKV